MIGGVSVLPVDSQSSVARLGGEVSLSFSRLCSFFGSWSRSQRASSARLPPHPRLFVIGEVRGGLKDNDWLADEGRLKFPLFLDRRLKRAVNLFFILALIVCVLGSGWSPLPVTLSLVPSQEDLKMAEASGGRVSLPAPAQLDNQYIQGVSAVIFSDHRLAYQAPLHGAPAATSLENRNAL